MTSTVKFGEVRKLVDLVHAEADKVSFEHIFENKNGGVNLLAFKAGQKLDKHLAPADVMVMVLEGEIQFNMGANSHSIKGGEFILMGADVPHSVEAVADTKLMLIKVKP